MNIDIYVLHLYLVGLVHCRTQQEIDKCVRELMNVCPPVGDTLDVIKACTGTRRTQIKELEEARANDTVGCQRS